MSPPSVSDWLRQLGQAAGTQIRHVVQRVRQGVEEAENVLAAQAEEVKTAAPPVSWRGQWLAERHSPAERTQFALDYWLYLPSPDPAVDWQGRPLLLMLHGCKQDAESFARGTRMNQLADREGFVVAYPQQSRQAHVHGCWHWYDPSPRAGGQEAAAIASLASALVSRFQLDASRVYLAGISAGAGMAGWLALRYPQQFAGLALHSGVALGAAHSMLGGLQVMRHGARGEPLAVLRRELASLAPVQTPTAAQESDLLQSYPGMPAILLHGERDSTVALDNLAQLRTQFLALNHLLVADGTLGPVPVREFKKQGACVTDYGLAASDRQPSPHPPHAPMPQLRVCRIAALGHAWSGGDPSQPFHAAEGPDASEWIWQFLSVQRR